MRGRIVDENGEPAIGAAVLVSGADNVGVVTDVDGNFSLTAPQGGDSYRILSGISDAGGASGSCSQCGTGAGFRGS